MIARLSLLLLLSGVPLFSFAQAIELTRLDPPFWWTDMAEEQLEVLVYGQNIQGCRASLNYPGVTLLEQTSVANPNYLFLQLEVSEAAQPGFLPIVFERGAAKLLVQYELRPRQSRGPAQGPVTQADLIYLIMPDRFANGNQENDLVAGLQEPEARREGKYQRHGGDLQGITERLDYLEDLGVTALWLNPVEINDQPHESYHGYAATDHYQVDPRLGGNEAYQTLVESSQARGIKVIRDVIFNHLGDQHWLMKDLPSPTWIHQWPEFTQTTYRAPTLLDPYASERDRKLMSDGWFDQHMPDLNQDDEHLATYLIQNSIWWIEHFRVNGYRIDTYAYPDQQFMARWAEAILAEYPDFSFFGETWVHSVPVQSWFTQSVQGKSLNSRLPGVTDFQLHYALNAALNDEFGWTEGLAELYYVLAQDYVYEDPWQNVIFLDNHDLGRFFATVNNDLDRFKMGIAFLLTTRGIPQLYYGTEILMDEPFNWDNHDLVRLEFPGGWPGDPVNKFEAAGREEQEEEAFQYIRALANFRKSSPALTEGTLTQFVPEAGLYVYARRHPDQTVLVIMNQEEEAQSLSTDRFTEILAPFRSAREVSTQTVYSNLQELQIPAKSALVLELLP